MKRTIVQGVLILSVAAAPSKRAYAQDKPCIPSVQKDGRLLLSGECIFNIHEGGAPRIHIRLMDGGPEAQSEVLLDSKDYSIELRQGAVRGLSGTAKPSITVRGTEHSVHADVSEMCIVWREDENHVTIESERGDVLVETTFGKNRTLSEGEWVHVDLEQPAVENTGCSIRWSGKAPNKHGMLLMAIAMSAFLLRSRRKQSS